MDPFFVFFCGFGSGGIFALLMLGIFIFFFRANRSMRQGMILSILEKNAGSGVNEMKGLSIVKASRGIVTRRKVYDDLMELEKAELVSSRAGDGPLRFYSR